jgi:murein L,D-transpeptidase YcbB/YkuD
MDLIRVFQRAFALSALLVAIGMPPVAAQWGGIRPLPADSFFRSDAEPAQPGQPVMPRPLPPAPPRANGPEQVTVSPSPEPTFAEDSVRNTQRVLALYRDIAARGGWPAVPSPPPGAKLALGATGPAVEALRRRLVATADLPANAADGDTFDMALEEGLRRFQLRHGLTTTGAVGPMTFKALNVPAEERVRQIEASLARLIEHDFVFTQRYVAVNLAAAAVEAVDGGRVVRRYPAVVGKPENASPELVARITTVNLNPTWTAPLSIVKKEILPKLARDPGYLARANMRLIDDSGRELDPTAVNLSGPVRFSVRQDSGSSNSLGFVRIDMPNDYSVYMHDTPRRELFQSDYRFHSHGCVRVGDVRALAAWLLEDVPGWSRSEIDAAIASGKRTDIRLAHAVPVVWIYLTGWGTADGTAHFREDVYDLDDRRKLDPTTVTAMRQPLTTGSTAFALQSAAKRVELKPSAHRLDDM